MNGRASGGFENVDLPLRVGRIRDIDPKPRKAMLIVVHPRLSAIAKVQPPTRNEQPFITVDVETLLLNPPRGTSSSLCDCRFQHIVMRQHMRLGKYPDRIQKATYRALKRFSNMP